MKNVFDSEKRQIMAASLRGGIFSGEILYIYRIWIIY